MNSLTFMFWKQPSSLNWFKCSSELLKNILGVGRRMFSIHIEDILGCSSVAGCRETLVFLVLKILYFHTWGSIALKLLISFPHKGIVRKGTFLGLILPFWESVISSKICFVYFRKIYRVQELTLSFQKP